MNKFERFIYFWLMLIDSITGILTFGFLCIDLAFDYCLYIAKRNAKKTLENGMEEK